MKYAINTHGHYFAIDDAVAVETIEGIKIFATEEELYAAAAAMYDLEVEEVEGTETYVPNNANALDIIANTTND